MCLLPLFAPLRQIDVLGGNPNGRKFLSSRTSG
jgi:hypothetical protein